MIENKSAVESGEIARMRSMAIEEQKVLVGVCDCGCGKQVVSNGSGLPQGFHGTIYEVTDKGQSESVEWFAARQTHIQKAATAAYWNHRTEKYKRSGSNGGGELKINVN